MQHFGHYYCHNLQTPSHSLPQIYSGKIIYASAVEKK
jgi:hypothetical protein